MESSSSSLSSFTENYRYFKKWIKTSPFAWFGLLLFGFFLLWILNDYVKDKKDLWKGMFEKRRSSPPSPGEPKESKGERAARAAAERIFGKPFIKIRPDILRNQVTNHNLEIDIYNDDLKIGIEYSGRQHYEFVPFFHKNYETFLNQKYRDEIKRMLCKEHQITLIEIPYTVKEENIESFLRIECIKRGLLKDE
jgi:hypothetical protein